MRVLGIDPGTRFMGYGVVEGRGSALVHVGHGVIRADAASALEVRLSQLFTELSAAVKAFRPEAVAVEGVFACRNPRSALILGHARGIALLVAAQTGLSVHEYSPARVKRAVGAGGAGDKGAVSRMVCTLLSLEAPERSDASDALAVAICHLNHGRVPLPSGPRSRRRGGMDALASRLSPSLLRYGAVS